MSACRFHRFSPLTVALVLAAAWCAAGCHRGPYAGPRHSVLLLTIDSLRADHLGCYGYRPPTSPRLDALAAQSILFRRAYATAPWTLPSHVSILTGLDAAAHGVDTDRAVLGPRAATLAGVLRRHGYHTGAIVCAPLLRERYGLAPGFDNYDTSLIAASYRAARRVKVASSVTKKALAFLDQSTDRPFFLWLHYWDPHYDYDPPPRYVELFDPGYRGRLDGYDIQNRTDIVPGMNPADLRHLIALYDGEIRYTDDGIGALLDGLRKRGLLNNTLIVVVGDHGEEFLDHGGTGHTWTCYEELVHVPLILHAPWLKPAAASFDEQVSITDIYPTVLSLLGIAYDPLKVQGRSLVNLITRGESLGARFLLMETRAGRLHPNGKVGLWTAMLTPAGAKLHHYAREETVEMLFDLAADPRERRDLSAERPAQVEELHAQLLQMRRRDHQLFERLRLSHEQALDRQQTDMLRGLGYLQ